VDARWGRQLTIEQKTADERLASRATPITTAPHAFDVFRMTLLKNVRLDSYSIFKSIGLILIKYRIKRTF
jgi:hypothetical protein